MKTDDRRTLIKFVGCGDPEDEIPIELIPTFTTAPDMMAVKRKLKEKQEWVSFTIFLIGKYAEMYRGRPHDVGAANPLFLDWLLDESRFCQLAADFKREEGGG